MEKSYQEILRENNILKEVNTHQNNKIIDLNKEVDTLKEGIKFLHDRINKIEKESVKKDFQLKEYEKLIGKKRR